MPEVLEWVKQRDTWMSDTIQNEIITMFAHSIQRLNVEVIKKAAFFGLTADGTTDISRHEQFSMNIRFVDECFEIRDCFVGFYQPQDTTSETLFGVIQDLLCRLGLPLNKLKGFAFDGASNMSGRFQGVQARLRQLCPAAVYVHCANHSLDLVLQEISREVRIVADTLQFIKDVTNVVNESARRLTLFQELFGTSEPIINLVSICPTRWCVRAHDECLPVTSRSLTH